MNDSSGGGLYVEAALFPIGVSIEQLVCNVAKWLRHDINSVIHVPWPPRVEDLEKEEELSLLMLKLLSALLGKRGWISLLPHSVTSLITQYVSKRPSSTAINPTITLNWGAHSQQEAC